MTESSNPEDQKTEEILEKENAISESEPLDSPPDSSNRVWFWVFAALLVGGFIGWVIGRQSGSVPEQSSALAAADAPIVVTATPLPADEVSEPEAETAKASEPEASTVAFGPTPASILPEAARVLGDPNAPVTIVEFSDYQCPFCRRHSLETMPLLKENFVDTGRVSYVFKDFPIASLHPLAYRMHEAARCITDAAGSDGYWQVHDLFFTDAETFQVDSLEAMDAAILAAFENADMPDVSECLQSNKYAEAVRADLSEGQNLGVNGTPAFFINGFPVSGAQPYELFEYAIGLAEEGKLQEAFAESAQTQAQAEAEATAQAAMPRDVPVGDEPAKGELDAPITIVEYSDYQCPFCFRHFENTMPQLQEYIDSGQVRYVFKDFPIHSIHPQAQKAHEAARCAREIDGDDAYWAMHDLLFNRQQEWGQAPVPDHETILKTFASEAGLPQDEFDECLDSGRYYDAVNAEVAEGVQLGVTGTPAFFLNGQPLTGAQPFPVFQQAIDRLLAGS